MTSYSKIRFSFENKTQITESDDLAYFTHYLHNSNNRASIKYEAKAHEFYSNTCLINETCWQDILPTD